MIQKNAERSGKYGVQDEEELEIAKTKRREDKKERREDQAEEEEIEQSR